MQQRKRSRLLRLNRFPGVGGHVASALIFFRVIAFHVVTVFVEFAHLLLVSGDFGDLFINPQLRVEFKQKAGRGKRGIGHTSLCASPFFRARRTATVYLMS
jgi:hypothetical protein